MDSANHAAKTTAIFLAIAHRRFGCLISNSPGPLPINKWIMCVKLNTPPPPPLPHAGHIGGDMREWYGKNSDVVKREQCLRVKFVFRQSNICLLIIDKCLPAYFNISLSSNKYAVELTISMPKVCGLLMSFIHDVSTSSIEMFFTSNCQRYALYEWTIYRLFMNREQTYITYKGSKTAQTWEIRNRNIRLIVNCSVSFIYRDKGVKDWLLMTCGHFY